MVNASKMPANGRTAKAKTSKQAKKRAAKPTAAQEKEMEKFLSIHPYVKIVFIQTMRREKTDGNLQITEELFKDAANTEEISLKSVKEQYILFRRTTYSEKCDTFSKQKEEENIRIFKEMMEVVKREVLEFPHRHKDLDEHEKRHFVDSIRVVVNQYWQKLTNVEISSVQIAKWIIKWQKEAKKDEQNEAEEAEKDEPRKKQSDQAEQENEQEQQTGHEQDQSMRDEQTGPDFEFDDHPDHEMEEDVPFEVNPTESPKSSHGGLDDIALEEEEVVIEQVEIFGNQNVLLDCEMTDLTPSTSPSSSDSRVFNDVQGPNENRYVRRSIWEDLMSPSLQELPELVRDRLHKHREAILNAESRFLRMSVEPTWITVGKQVKQQAEVVFQANCSLVKVKDYLLLPNLPGRNDCFLIACVNALFVCKGLRAIFQKENFAFAGKLVRFLQKIFKNEEHSVHNLRLSLKPQFHGKRQHDAAEVLHDILDNLADLSEQSVVFEKTKCRTHEPKQAVVSFSNWWMPDNASISEVIENNRISDVECKQCGNNSAANQKPDQPEQSGSHHIVNLLHGNAARFNGGETNDVFQMYGAYWYLVALIEYIPDLSRERGEKGHYKTWIRHSNEKNKKHWRCIDGADDKTTEEEDKFTLRDKEICTMVFEKIV